MRAATPTCGRRFAEASRISLPPPRRPRLRLSCPGTPRHPGVGCMSFGKIGKVSVLGTLGTGAHSTILHVRREADGKQYALKVVNIDGPEEQKFLDQARHEFRVGEMLEHPNIIQVFALDEHKD